MKIKEFILGELTHKIMKEVVNSLDLDGKISKIAIDILDTTDTEYKEMLFRKYNKLKQLQECLFDNYELEYFPLDMEIRKLIQDKLI